MAGSINYSDSDPIDTPSALQGCLSGGFKTITNVGRVADDKSDRDCEVRVQLFLAVVEMF